MLSRACRKLAVVGVISLVWVSLSPRGWAEAVKVEVRQVDDGWRLYCDEKPFFIKGAGGDGSRSLLKEIGGNCVRTWGVDGDTARLLDDAERQGLMVCLGIWLGHERQGFNYNKAGAVLQQREKAREAVLKFRSHPALLLWGIGNEMEGTGQGDNPAVWYALRQWSNSSIPSTPR